jgi:hypothetical protein
MMIIVPSLRRLAAKQSVPAKRCCMPSKRPLWTASRGRQPASGERGVLGAQLPIDPVKAQLEGRAQVQRHHQRARQPVLVEPNELEER